MNEWMNVSACFDTLYIVFGGINYTMKAFELANTRNIIFCKIKHNIIKIVICSVFELLLDLTLKRLGGGPFKIVVSWKISTLTYPEKSWLFLKQSKEAFCKNKIEKNLAAWKSRVTNKSAKTSKFDQIVWFSHWKIPQIKKLPGEKVFILVKDVIVERKIEMKAKNKIGLKEAFISVHPNSGSLSQIAWIYFTKCSSCNKIFTLWKM